MGLKHLSLARVTVKTSGGDFDVRGLSLPDITAIVADNEAILSTLFAELTARQQGGAVNDISSLVAMVARAAPGSMAKIIAIAADDDNEDGLAIARSLPFPVQIAALEEIGKLTFATEGAAKKVVEIVIRMARGATEAMASLRLSAIGSGAFDGR